MSSLLLENTNLVFYTPNHILILHHSLSTHFTLHRNTDHHHTQHRCTSFVSISYPQHITVQSRLILVMSDNITEHMMSTPHTTPTLMSLPLELKEIIFHYVLESECRSRICWRWRSPPESVHACRYYLPSLLLVNKQLEYEFATFFYRRITFVLDCPEGYLDDAYCRAHYTGVMRIFANIEVKVSHLFLAKNIGSTQLTGLRVHENNVTTIVLSSNLLWEDLNWGQCRSSLESHRNIITALQDWQSTLRNSVITMAPLDRVTKYKARRAVNARRECLMNHHEVQRAWRQAFGAEMIANKIVEECCRPPS